MFSSKCYVGLRGFWSVGAFVDTIATSDIGYALPYKEDVKDLIKFEFTQ